MDIEKNIQAVKAKITAAAEASGRDPGDIQLIAVTKTVGVEEVLRAFEAGIDVFGENRVQSLLDKLDKINNGDYPSGLKNAKWHLIGHLQTNKVKYIVDKVTLIHSVDSIRLAEEISRVAKNKGICCECLLEVNISGEESKYGLKPNEIGEFTEAFAELSNIRLKGLMTMAPLDATEEEKHNVFAGLRELSKDKAFEGKENISMTVLSMGMSGDFEEAIAEGATCIRVGTSIFH